MLNLEITSTGQREQHGAMKPDLQVMSLWDCLGFC